jgi:hypothetical protein
MDLRRRAFGIALGIMNSLVFLLINYWLLFIDAQAEVLTIFSKIFYGYTFSWVGTLIGTVSVFFFSFLLGVFLAWIYNLLSRLIYKQW